MSASKTHMTLTPEDIEAIRQSMVCHATGGDCAFTQEEIETLRSLARNTNTAAKLATRTIITGMVLGTLSMIWMALKYWFSAVLSGKLQSP